MVKFERNENGEYECPECERKYEKYNSFYQHYRLKHGNSETVENTNNAVKSITAKAKEIPKTVTKKIMGSDSGNDSVDDDKESTEIENNSSVTPKKKIKRVRLKPVEPPVKKSQTDTENEEENKEEAETKNSLIHGILHGFSKNERKVSEKLKVSEEEPKRKYLFIEGII